MAKASFEAALSRLLSDEGGYSHHPSDPGGPTNFGITLADARRYWKAGASAADVKRMPVSVAQTIYREKYWNALRCDELPAGLDYAVFDYGVNSGVARAGKVLRRVLKLSDRASRVTDEVVAAATAASARSSVAALCDERLLFLKGLNTWPVFGVGWARRVAGVRATSLKMAAAQSEAGQTSDVSRAGVVTGAAVVVTATGAAATLQSDDIPVGVVVGLLFAAALLGAGFVWWWRRRVEADRAKSLAPSS